MKPYDHRQKLRIEHANFAHLLNFHSYLLLKVVKNKLILTSPHLYIGINECIM